MGSCFHGVSQSCCFALSFSMSYPTSSLPIHTFMHGPWMGLTLLHFHLWIYKYPTPATIYLTAEQYGILFGAVWSRSLCAVGSSSTPMSRRVTAEGRSITSFVMWWSLLKRPLSRSGPLLGRCISGFPFVTYANKWSVCLFCPTWNALLTLK